VEAKAGSALVSKQRPIECPQRENGAAHREKIGPKIGPKIGKSKNRRILIFLIIFVIKVRWEHLHWTNLGLTKLMEVRVFNIDFAKIHCLQNSSFLKPK